MFGNVKNVIVDQEIRYYTYFHYVAAQLQIKLLEDGLLSVRVLDTALRHVYFEKLGVKFIKLIETKEDEFELETTPNSKIYLQILTDYNRQELKKCFEDIPHLFQFVPKTKSSGIFSGSEPSQQFEPFAPVNQWSVDDVVRWLSYLRGVKDSQSSDLIPLSECVVGSDTIGNFFKKQLINGATLLTLDRESLFKELKLPFAYVREILEEIQFLKQNNGFDCKFLNILHKFSSKGSTSHSISADVYDQYKKARNNLVNALDFKLAYMNVDKLPERILKNFKIKLVITELDNSGSKTKRMFAQLGEQLGIVSCKYGIFHTALTVGPWFLDWTTQAVCIPRQISSSKALFCGDVGLNIDLIGENLSLTEKKQKIQSIVDSIAEFVVHANLNWKYINQGRKWDASGGNCQDFTQEILGRIGAKINFGKQVQSLLERMAKGGENSFEYKTIYPHFVELYPTIQNMIKEFRNSNTGVHVHNRLSDIELQNMFKADGTICFSSHVQLDLFCSILFEQLQKIEKISFEEVKQKYASEFELLKSYDRAFWLRYIKHDRALNYWTSNGRCIKQAIENAKTQELRDELNKQNIMCNERSRWGTFRKEAHRCAFGNPHDNASIEMELFANNK